MRVLPYAFFFSNDFLDCPDAARPPPPRLKCAACTARCKEIERYGDFSVFFTAARWPLCDRLERYIKFDR